MARYAHKKGTTYAKPGDVRPIRNIHSDAIGDRDVVADNELAPFEMGIAGGPTARNFLRAMAMAAVRMERYVSWVGT